MWLSNEEIKKKFIEITGEDVKIDDSADGYFYMVRSRNYGRTYDFSKSIKPIVITINYYNESISEVNGVKNITYSPELLIRIKHRNSKHIYNIIGENFGITHQWHEEGPDENDVISLSHRFYGEEKDFEKFFDEFKRIIFQIIVEN